MYWLCFPSLLFCHYLLLLLLLQLEGSWSLSSSSLNTNTNIHVIVAGKIIVDEYGDPSKSEAPTTVTVGGGGPQAAMGAALGLAARSLLHQGNGTTTSSSSNKPPKQPVTLVAPVGDLDFTAEEEASLMEVLGDALLYPPKFLRGKNLITPRIRLWHDDDQDQTQQWYAMNDSFGERGAAGLWGQLPTVDDYLEVIKTQQSTEQIQKPILSIICEGGPEAPGKNGDSTPLLDPSLRDAISFLGVEPILFPNAQEVVGEEDAKHCADILQQIIDATPSSSKEPSVVISPDMAAFTAIQRSGRTPQFTTCLDSWAVRHGPQGSQIHTSTSRANGSHCKIPAATLQQMVNPTGAGNSFAAAYTALRGSGSDSIESACLATGVGAVFCEYPHCPPWTWEVVQRVVQASQEVRAKVELQQQHDNADDDCNPGCSDENASKISSTGQAKS